MSVFDFFKLSVCGFANTQYTCNNFVFRASPYSAPELDLMQDLVSAWRATVEPSWLATLTSDYSLQGYRVYDPGGSLFTPLGLSIVGPINGTRAGMSVTSGLGGKILTAYQIQGTTRWRRSPIPFPSCVEGDFASNRIDAGYEALLQTFADAIATPLSGSLATYTYGVSPHLNADPWYPLPQLTVSPHATALRRRFTRNGYGGRVGNRYQYIAPYFRAYSCLTFSTSRGSWYLPNTWDAHWPTTMPFGGWFYASGAHQSLIPVPGISPNTIAWLWPAYTVGPVDYVPAFYFQATTDATGPYGWCVLYAAGLPLYASTPGPCGNSNVSLQAPYDYIDSLTGTHTGIACPAVNAHLW